MIVARSMRHRRGNVLQRYITAIDLNPRKRQLVERHILVARPGSGWSNDASIGIPQRLYQHHHLYFSSTASQTTTGSTEAIQVENKSTIRHQYEQDTSVESQHSRHHSPHPVEHIITKNEAVPVANQPQMHNRKMSLSSSTKSTKKLHIDATNIFERATEICNETIYPISAFADVKGNYRHFMMVFRAVITEAERLIQSKYHSSKNTSGNEMIAHPGGQISDTINLAFQLLERISREPWHTPNQNVPLQKYYKPQYTNMLLQIWNVAALRNEPNLLSAYHVTQLVKKISYKHLYSHNHAEQPRYDPSTIAMLLQVALHEARNILTPSMEQQPMFNEQTTELKESKMYPSTVSPNMRNEPSAATSPKELVVYLYNALVKAHSESNNKDVDKTIKIIYGVMEEMRVKHFIQPNAITYNILLRFLRLSNSESLESFQFAFQRMQLEKITPNMSTYNEVVQCYTTNKFVNQQQLDIAEQYIKHMIEIVLTVGPVRDDDKSISKDERQRYYSDVTLITNGAQSLMDAYVREFMKQPSPQQRQEIVSRAKGLFLLLDKNNISSGTSTLQLLSTIMYMNERCGNLSASKMILTEILNPTIPLYGSMIKAYGEADRINDAIDVFNTMLNDQRVTPNIYTFNVLLNTCSISKTLGHMAYDRATELVSLLNTNERCVHFQLRPDKVTYNTLLKCLTKSSTCKEGASMIAETILLEMEERSKTDDQIKPNLITFNLAIAVCLLVNDQERMNVFMNKMEQYNLKADARLCNTILNQYAQAGTYESAERAESFLMNLKKMGETDKSVRPNVYTYNIVLNAWGRSNHPNFAQRMLSSYESMLRDQVIPDAITYNTLVFHLTKMPNNIGVADKLLQELENSNNVKYQPGYEVYKELIKAYIKFRDVENASRILFRWFGVARGNPTVPQHRDLVIESMAPLYHQLAQMCIQLGDLERATTVTEKIYDLYVDGSREQATLVPKKGHGTSIPEPPSVKTYLLLYEAWNKSSHQSKEMYLAKIRARIDSYQQ